MNPYFLRTMRKPARETTMPPPLTFAYTITYVADVEASLAFFEQAFGLKRRFVAPGGGYGELETGGTALAFAQHATARGNLGRDYVAADASAAPLGVEIGLTSSDVAAACERALKAGATLLAPPATKPWGQTVAYVRCPDGTLVEVCTAMG
jgi:lactoylglutathione lyase